MTNEKYIWAKDRIKTKENNPGFLKEKVKMLEEEIKPMGNRIDELEGAMHEFIESYEDKKNYTGYIIYKKFKKLLEEK